MLGKLLLFLSHVIQCSTRDEMRCPFAQRVLNGELYLYARRIQTIASEVRLACWNLETGLQSASSLPVSLWSQAAGAGSIVQTGRLIVTAGTREVMKSWRQAKTTESSLRLSDDNGGGDDDSTISMHGVDSPPHTGETKTCREYCVSVWRAVEGRKKSPLDAEQHTG